MSQRFQQAQALEARAVAARSLAEAQALHAQADRLRGRRGAALLAWVRQPLFRN
jgi:hypothetical protein